MFFFLSLFEEADDSTSSSNSPVHCDANVQSGQRPVGSPEYLKTNRSFRRLWGKWACRWHVNAPSSPMDKWTSISVTPTIPDYEEHSLEDSRQQIQRLVHFREGVYEQQQDPGWPAPPKLLHPHGTAQHTPALVLCFCLLPFKWMTKTVTQLINVNLFIFFPVIWVSRSVSGLRSRCVAGWRTLDWASMSVWPDSGWKADRRYCRQHVRMSRRSESKIRKICAWLTWRIKKLHLVRRIRCTNRQSFLTSGDEDEEPAAQEEATTGSESLFH